MKQILIAGFGGQGILFSGKLLANAGLIEGKNVSWLPSYGPEMRGGTANCSVIISDTTIGSPIAGNPDILMAYTLPAIDKFEDKVQAGGKMFLDSSLIERKAERKDADAFYVPATKLAFDNECSGLMNMIIMGKMIKETNICSEETIYEAVKKTVPESKKNLIELNIKAIKIGLEQ